MTTPPPHKLSVPDKETIAALPLFDRLGLDRITLVHTAEQAREARARLAELPFWGFDTESKPTFKVGEVSDGPHIVQLASCSHAWVFQIHDGACRDIVGDLLALEGIQKAGFGLGDDRKRIVMKLGVQPAGILELNQLFQERGYRKDMGVKGAVAVVFNQRYIKSKKAATSNWASPRLTEAQIIYSANDAYAAARVYAALVTG